MLSSFVYEDLISHIQTIRNQMFEIENILSNRWKNEKRKRDELKSRSLVFIDPYGNRTVDKYMDHELINNIIRKYKKDYIPKYLQKWIQIGTMNENIISSLNDYELMLTASKYRNGYQFITHSVVTVLINTDEIRRVEQFVLPVLLMDNMDKIKLKIKNRFQYDDMELKLWKIKNKIFDEGTMLKSEDTIMSCQLYEDNCIIMAKIITKKVNCNIFFSSSYSVT
jgi:hypothetical protein